MAIESGPGLDVLIRAVLDAKGFEDLKARLKQVQEAHKDAKPSVSEFEQALGNMGKQALAATGVLVGVGEILAFLKTSFSEFVEASRAMEQFAAVNRQVGETSEAAVKRNAAWIDSMEMASGIAETKLVPAYMKLVEITGNVSQAQALTQIAAGAAARGMGEVGESATLLGRFLLKPDGPIRGTSALAFELKRMQAEGKTTKQIMTVLAKEYGDAGAKVKNVGIEVDRNRETWKNFKEAIGETGASIVTLVRPAMVGLAYGIGLVVAGIQKAIGFVGAMGIGLGALGKAALEFISGNFKAAGAALAEGDRKAKALYERWDKTADETMNRVVDVFNRSTSEIKTQAEVAAGAIAAAGKKKALTIEQIKNAYETELTAAQVAAAGEIAALLAVAAIYGKMAKDRRLTELDRQTALLNQKKAIQEIGKLTAKAAEDEIHAEEKRFAAWLKIATAEVATFRKGKDEEAKIALKNYETLHRNDLTYLAKYSAFTAALTANWAGSEEERAAISRQAAERKMQIAELEAQQRDQLLAGSLTTLGNFFKLGKELSIAQAIINTYEGATKALSQGGIYGVALAAIVIAAGLAQVATIAAQEPGSSGSFTGPSGGFGSATGHPSAGGGFDDPQNDYAAYMGGRKWAQDMVNQVAAGFADELKTTRWPGAGSSTTTNIVNRQGDRHSVVNVSGVGLIDSGSDVMLRRFARQLQPHLNVLEKSRTPS